jgi:glycosyltransferase involved in cell wall biosynthesis
MNIGIDARTLTGNRSGVGNYLLNIIEAGAFDDHVVYAYYDTPEETLPDIDAPEETDFRWRLIESPDLVNRISGPAQPIWWINITLHRELKRDGMDAFFGPNFVQPVLFDKPSVIIVHDVIHRTLPEVHTKTYRLYLRTFLAASVRQADRVLTVSEHSKNDFLQYHPLSTDRVRVAYGAADGVYRPRDLASETRERLCQTFGIPDQFILYVGNIEPRKNLVAVIEAMHRFSDEERPALVVVGKEHLAYGALERMLEQCPFRDQIHFTGYVPDDDLPLLYNMSSLFVYPSLYEGFGLPVLEAMQSGTPVITSDRTSIPEVVDNAGVTLDPNDRDAIANAIQRLWTNEEVREEYRERGLRQAENFSWNRTATKISETIEQLIDTAAKTRH